MLILNATEVRQALPMNDAIAAMKDAYASLSDGTAVAPLRTRIPIPSRDAISLFMPAYMKKESTEALAVKVVSLYPSNPPRGLAYIQAAVLVFDAETGRAIALLEGSALTAIRTAQEAARRLTCSRAKTAKSSPSSARDHRERLNSKPRAPLARSRPRSSIIQRL